MKPFVQFNLFLIVSFFLLFSNIVKSQYIQVNSNYTAEQLVRDIFLGSSCIEVIEESISIQGSTNPSNKSWGYFNRQNSNFPINEEIVLSTGRIDDAPGPKRQIQSYDEATWRGDRDLEEALEMSNTLNATILEFEFISSQDEVISFQYLFASEQYLTNPRPDQCNYTDGFAFLIKEADSRDDYLNIALIPYTFTPVAVNTVRGPGTVCPPKNIAYFGQYNSGNSAINFNGQTVVLDATTNVQKNKRYKLKLVIADQGNGLYDSAVFLKARSFSAEKDLGEDRLVENGNALCFGSTLTLDASLPNVSTYQWYKNGEAISGANSNLYTIDSPGFYEVEISLTSGCSIRGNIRIEYNALANLNQTSFEFCDEDLDGIINITLANYNSQIISTTSPVRIKYFLTEEDARNKQNEINTLILNQTENFKSIYAQSK